MSWRTKRRVGACAWLAAATIAVPAMAQVPTPVPAPLPTSSPTPPAPLPVPAAPVIVLPAATPSPVATVGAPTPRPTAVPAPRSSVLPTAVHAPTLGSAPTPTPTPIIAAPPVALPPPDATVVSTPIVAPVLTPPASDGNPRYWPVALVAGLALLLALAWVLVRRRSTAASLAARVAVPAAPPSSDQPARLTITLRPIRAGLNLLTATSENEIVVTNNGGLPATDIRLAVALISAPADQDAELAILYDTPIGRSAVPAFVLQPGEQRVVTAVAALLRDAIKPLTAAGRPMFVPIVAVNMTYVTGGGGEAQLAQAFAVGVERVDSPKLAPFWLDVPPRSFDQVAAWAHGAVVER